MSDIPVKSPVLSLRRTGDSDLKFVVSAEGAAENRRFVSQQPEDEHRAMITDSNILHLIAETDMGPVGYVILSGLNNKSRSIELMRILITEKGKGHGREALRLCKILAFEKLSAHRLWLDVVQYNQRALNLYLSEGFVQEGVLRECDLFEGRFESLVILSMLEREYLRA